MSQHFDIQWLHLKFLITHVHRLLGLDLWRRLQLLHCACQLRELPNAHSAHCLVESRLTRRVGHVGVIVGGGIPVPSGVVALDLPLMVAAAFALLEILLSTPGDAPPPQASSEDAGTRCEAEPRTAALRRFRD